VLSVKRATFSAAKNAWTIAVTTTWFAPQLTQTTLTCSVGRVAGAGALIGSNLFDATGTTQIVTANPLTTPPPDATNNFTCKSSNGAVVTGVVKRI
jgi:hypothetical protein